jgi:glycosyltransferase involved in cell wall biosynthesis
MEWNYPVGAYDAPWLSILIPAYNAESYIEECLRSIFSQSLHGVEIIVVNDCSTDQTVSITEQLVASFPGASLKFLHNETNRGLSFTRNRMLDICNGQYVWFVDADDCVRPDAITQLKRIVDEHAPDFVVCDFADYHKN